MSKRRFAIRVVGEVVLDVDAIWPEGDAPEDPQPSDVQQVLDRWGDIGGVLTEWSMEKHFKFEVLPAWTPNGEEKT